MDTFFRQIPFNEITKDCDVTIVKKKLQEIPASTIFSALKTPHFEGCFVLLNTFLLIRFIPATLATAALFLKSNGEMVVCFLKYFTK